MGMQARAGGDETRFFFFGITWQSRRRFGMDGWMGKGGRLPLRSFLHGKTGRDRYLNN